jgi:hypothetical protein
MAEQAQSSSESNVQEMLLELMKEMRGQSQETRGQFHKFDNKFQEMNNKFQEMHEKFDNKFQEMRGESQETRKQFDKKFQEMHEQFQDMKVEFRQTREETSKAQLSEIEVPTNPKISSAKKRRIRKVRTLKSFGLTKRIRGNPKVREYNRLIKQKHEQNETRKKCNTAIYRKVPLIHPSEVKGRSKVLQNVPSKVKTKVNFSKEKVFQKVKSKETSEKHKKQITSVNSTRRLGEQLCTKCPKNKEIYNVQSNETSEKLKNCTNCQMLQSSFQTRTKVNNRNKRKTNLNIHSEHLHEKCTNRVKLKCQGEMPHERLMKESIQTEHKLKVGNSANKNSDKQGLQQLFQKGIKLTKSSHKLGTKWPELIQGKKTDKNRFFKMKEGLPLLKAKQIPFKMKRKVIRDSGSKVSFKMKRKDEIVKFRKINVKMKVMSEQVNFGKLKWKFKNGIYDPKTKC